MKINYKTTFRDLVAFSWYHNARSPVLVCLMLLLSGFISWNMFRTLAKEYPTVVIVLSWLLMTTVIFASMFSITLLVAVLAAISRKNKTVLTDNTIELTNDKIISENRYGRSELVWDIVQKLRRTKRSIFIYTAQSQAIVVPKRAFRSEQEWNAFYDLLKSHCESAAAH